MSTDMLLYVIYGVGGIFAIIVIAYFILSRKMQNMQLVVILQKYFLKH